MSENNREKGSRYEEMAADFLIKQGMKIVERNFRCYTGEIDIIARDGKYLCFVEVKYRYKGKSGYPQEAVGLQKQRRIYNTAAAYLKFHKLPMSTLCRFDVVSVLGNEITYIKNAFVR